jgi:hypothetical protein
MIDAETKVSDNYQRLVSQAMDDLFGGDQDALNVGELRDLHIGRVRDAMWQIFPDLELQGPGNPMGGGTFFFRKAGASQFHYKNLSGGEKAAFDLLLDLVVKTAVYDDAVFFIDEPELHLNTRLQAKLLETILTLLNADSQLWIATHSIGMMREAQQLHAQNADDVVFFDFEGHDFDQPVVLAGVHPSRDFWARQLRVALGDLADLVAPDCVVLCEGKPAHGNVARAEFDARCYRRIFAHERPGTDFVSVGNAVEVQHDRVELGRTIQTLVSGTVVIRLIDRDMRSPQEVSDAQASGIRVLRRRHLESYLLDDDVLRTLAESVGKAHLGTEVLAAKADAIANSVARGNDTDDLKSAAGELYTKARQLLGLTGAGNTTESFLADTLAPLVAHPLPVYDELKEDIFGDLA